MKRTNICIIGGGAAGLATLKILQDTEEVQNGTWHMVAYEARDAIGGVWYPCPPVGNPPASPIYDSLTTNLPHPVMAYSSFWFNPGTPLFPPASTVLEYLQSYVAHFDLLKYVQLNSKVEEAIWESESWNVRLSDGRTRQFDKLIVANGHYSAPRYPVVPGVKHWIETGRASHSMYFRNELPYKRQVVLVIGNGPSGQDIRTEIAKVATKVYSSITGGTPHKIGNIHQRGRVIEFKVDGTVIFDDGGPPSEIIDHALLATGYVMSFPFLPQLRSGTMPEVPPLPTQLINTSYGVFPLAKHLLPLQCNIPSGAIAFVGLPIRVVPFPLFETQCLYLIKTYRDEGTVNEAEECKNVIERFDTLYEGEGHRLESVAKKWHVLDDGNQFIYRKELLDIACATPECYPEEWALRIYRHKSELRSIWKKLEHEGQADEWVKNIGKGGRYEWVDMMDRLLDSVENQTPRSRET
ncbi:FAD/NAD(P)-binding domain-containing protein [Hysterangium stoloniferum]|nr:FAD/NAD(P)-binding domain-containing protein [Hysterangium stoloniferum]